MTRPDHVKKVAVTGASGHLGANLVRELLGRGYEVVALIRESSRALDGLDVQKVPANLSDPQSLCRAFRGVEQVYHLAACISMQPGDLEKLMVVNVEGTRNVIGACLSEGVATLVYFSTVHALDQQPLDREVTEENALLDQRQGGSGAYEYSKAQAERLVREVDSTALGTRIIYPSAVIGPNDFKLSLIGQALLKMAHGQLPALIEGGYDWVDARDVCWGAVEAAEKGVDKDRFILSGHYRSISEVAAEITNLTGTPAPRFTSPAWLAKLFLPAMGAWQRLRGEAAIYTRDSLSALCSNKNISHARATEELAYQSRSFHRSMQDAMRGYSANRQLEVTLNDR